MGVACVAGWAGIFALIVLAYLPAFAVDFLQEDFGLVNLTEHGRLSVAKTLRYFYPTHLDGFPFLRPVPILTAAADFLVWGVNPVGFHLTNLLIHLAGTILVGLTAGKLARSRSVAMLAAVVYGLYPGHVEAVVWLEHRMVGLGLVFMLCSLHLVRRPKLRPLAWVAALAALLCKEIAVVLPLVVFVHELALSGRIPTNGSGRGRRLVAAFRTAAPFLAVLAVYFAWRCLVFGRIDAGYGSQDSVVDHFLTERIYADLPATLSRFLSPVSSAAVGAWAVASHAILSGVGLVTLAILWWRAGRIAGRLVVFGLVFGLLALAVALPNLRVDDTLHNARLFSPAAVGLACCVAAGLMAVPRRWRIPAVAALGLYCAVLPANIRPLKIASDVSHAVRKGIEAQAAGYDPEVRVVVARVPYKVRGVPIFVDGLMLQAALSPPFTDRAIPVLPMVMNPPRDPDALILGLPGRWALLSVELDGPDGPARVREIARTPAAWRYEVPETLHVHGPIGGAAVRLAEDPAFVFSEGAGFPYYRLVFRMHGFTFALTVDRASRLTRDAQGRLTYRISRGDVLHDGSFLDRPDLASLGGRMDWWVEGVNDYTVPRNAVARSPVAHFTVEASARRDSRADG